MNWLAFDRYAVWGLGVSGVASANLLARRGKEVVASDLRDESHLESVRERLHPDVKVVAGRNVRDQAQVVVASPGLKPSLPAFVDLAIPVISEVELAFDAASAQFLAITGTDGKTTTTSLAAHVLESCGINTAAAGNIGTPLCDVVERFNAGDFIVAEVSAFQLWSTHHFRPHASAFTNIAEDHLDYFSNFQEYVSAKRRIIAFAESTDSAVFNLADATIRTWVEAFPGRVRTYGVEPAIGDHLWSDGEYIRNEAGAILTLADCQLRGHHNAMNMMAAIHLALEAGLPLDAVVNAVQTFKPLAHRIEPVTEVSGVWFYDDSKATNVHAAMAGINSLDGPLVVIAGGVDKGLDLGPFAALLAQRADFVVIIGEVSDRLSAALTAAGYGRFEQAQEMDEAVRRAFTAARGRGSVILSPACSSFDMFKSYAHRGEVFQAAVKALR